jgi:predicted dehydrogenase
MHVQAIRRTGAEIAGIWDTDPALALSFADREGSVPCLSLSALIAARPDAAVVMNSPLAMSDRRLAAATANLPSIFERPIACIADRQSAMGLIDQAEMARLNLTSPGARPNVGGHGAGCHGADGSGPWRISRRGVWTRRRSKTILPA